MQHRLLLLDALLIILAAAFVTLGAERVPFHGDESTIIWLSKDYALFRDGDFEEMYYEPPPRRTTEQHLRILNGTLTRLIYGAVWDGMGLEADDVNEQWVWGQDYQFNLTEGHVPSDRLLYAERLASAWMTLLGGVFLMGAARVLARHMWMSRWGVTLSGWLALAVYATHPAILLNGRRAMFEGAHLLGIAALGWLVVWMLARNKHLWQHHALLGVLTGIILTIKFSVTFTVALLFGGLVLLILLDRRFYELLKIGLATVLALLVFLVLSPLWWSALLEMPSIVVEERRDLLELQASLYGEFDGPGDRLSTLFDEIVVPEPQYFEVPEWGIVYPAVYDEIDRYETWSGLGDNILARMVRYLLLGGGVAVLIYTERWRMAVLLGSWLVGVLVITLITVPLGWQRYYLPVQVPLVILMGLGSGVIYELVAGRFLASSE
ncbi:MAG: hypothetical protein L0154_08490 [Chloroflexi bacterium]|nr:hypothetical protein [Chloroflexota bacterium]